MIQCVFNIWCKTFLHMNILSVTTLKCVLAEGIVHTVSNEVISQNHSLTYLLNTTCSGCRKNKNMVYQVTPDLHSCVWWFCKWKINPHILKIKAIGKNNGELIAGKIAAEENLILLLMEVHLLFINLFSKRYATWQLNQLTQSLRIFLVHDHHLVLAEKTTLIRHSQVQNALLHCQRPGCLLSASGLVSHKVFTWFWKHKVRP